MKYYTPDKSKKIYVSSDFHGFHKNIARGSSSWKDGYRDFDDEFVMTDILVENVNKEVGFDDILYYGGDWSFAGKDNIKKLRDRINCRTIILLLGNHDHHIRNNIEYQQLFTHVSSYEEFRYKGQLICFSHYPLGSWNEIGKGAINLFGHCHANYGRVIGKQRDVGVDASNFKPLLLDTVVSDMEKVSIEFTDHHTKETNYH